MWFSVIRLGNMLKNSKNPSVLLSFIITLQTEEIVLILSVTWSCGLTTSLALLHPLVSSSCHWIGYILGQSERLSHERLPDDGELFDAPLTLFTCGEFK